jgi:tungstate transport system ATP-binding protein
MSAAYSLEGVSFTHGTAVVLRIDALEIEAGRITALVGPNGSGKTTLLSLLAFLEAPVGGRLLFMGAETPPQSHARLRRRVGFVHQKPYLFHASVRKNLEFGLRWHGVATGERRRRVEHAIREFDLLPLADRSAARLSGGEAQKLALARALVLDPQVVLLDEAFSQLDAQARSALEERLRRLRDECGKTVVFSTHDDRLARQFADRTCHLFEGRIRLAPGVNLFRGRVSGEHFDTGRLRIHAVGLPAGTTLVGVTDDCIVLSRAELESSMRNNFRGTVQVLGEHNGRVEVTVDAGEIFHVLVTRQSALEMQLAVGSIVWVGFKSSAVQGC